MDEQTRALYQQLLAELYRRMADDPQIRRALKRIEEGKATFLDTALWSDRSAELLGTVFSEAIVDMPAEARESLCKALLRERYDSTYDLCGEVQEALDERLGISLKPVKPKFPAERVQQIAHSLMDPTVVAATIERRARAPVATAARSFHDDYIRENASVRTDLGFKCYLHRIAATGCCPWCTDIAGRYVYGDHPDDVFRRHDNCSCTVTFENGRQRQDVWSKKTWDAHDPEEVERLAQEPVVNSQERAREIEENAVSGLTLAGKCDIMNIKLDDIEAAITGSPISEEVATYIFNVLAEQGDQFKFDRVRILSLGSKIVMQTDPVQIGSFYDIVLNLNVDFLGGKTVEEIDKEIKESNVSVITSLREAVIHEIYHARTMYGKNKGEIDAQHEELSGRGVLGISPTALKNGFESIAEAGVLLERGDIDSIPDEAKALLRSYLGVKI